MKSKEGRVKMSISLPAPMVEWLKREAERELEDVSGIIKRTLLPAMRQEKKANTHEEDSPLGHQRTPVLPISRGAGVSGLNLRK